MGGKVPETRWSRYWKSCLAVEKVLIVERLNFKKRFKDLEDFGMNMFIYVIGIDAHQHHKL